VFVDFESESINVGVSLVYLLTVFKRKTVSIQTNVQSRNRISKYSLATKEFSIFYITNKKRIRATYFLQTLEIRYFDLIGSFNCLVESVLQHILGKHLIDTAFTQILFVLKKVLKLSDIVPKPTTFNGFLNSFNGFLYFHLAPNESGQYYENIIINNHPHAIIAGSYIYEYTPSISKNNFPFTVLE
jgi:hypothetical protein